MRRLSIAFALAALIAAACAIKTIPTPGVVQLYAASLPYSATFSWNANAASENITSYQVTLDGTTTTVLPTVCTGTPSVCSTQLLLNSFGPHRASVAGVNLSLSGDPGVTGTPVVGAASSLNLNLNNNATAPTGTTLK